MTVVSVHGGPEGLAQEILVADPDGTSPARGVRHRLIADEPAEAGGADRGPTPYDLLLAALGS